MRFKQLPAAGWTRETAAHLLRRAGFGGSPQETYAFHALGLEGAINHLLTPPPAGLECPVNPLPQGHDLAKRMAEMSDIDQAGRRAAMAERRVEERKELVKVQDWWLQEMYRSGDRVLEKVTLFWHGHFATSFQKVNRAAFMAAQNVTLREQALGSFPELVKAVSRDPAMIIWLDLRGSSSPVPNENFARELLELFTLGEGNYKEEDIKEIARAFTGYRIGPQGRFWQAPRHTDHGVKRVFGRSGRLTGDDVIDIATAQPQCARFLCAKIWRYFVGNQLEDPLLGDLAEYWRRERLEMRPLLERLFSLEAFYHPSVIANQIKSPIQWIVQTCRSFELGSVPTLPAARAMRELGQVLFLPPNVKGWVGDKSWITTATLTARNNLVLQLLGLEPSRRQELAARFVSQNGFEPVTATLDIEKICGRISELDTDTELQTLAERAFGPGHYPHEIEVMRREMEEAGRSAATMQRLVKTLVTSPRFQLC